MDPWMIGGAVGAAAVVLWAVSRRRRLGPEVSVGSRLQKLDGQYTVLTGSIVQGKQGMIRLDYAVVSAYGVFIIKECRDAGRVEVRLNQEEWPVSGLGGRKKLYNPVWEVRKVIQKLERLAGEYPFIPLVVFTRARLMGDRDGAILEAGKLIGHIQSFKELRLTGEQKKKFLGILS